MGKRHNMLWICEYGKRADTKQNQGLWVEVQKYALYSCSASARCFLKRRRTTAAEFCMKEGQLLNRQRWIRVFTSDSESPLLPLRASPPKNMNKSNYKNQCEDSDSHHLRDLALESIAQYSHDVGWWNLKQTRKSMLVKCQNQSWVILSPTLWRIMSECQGAPVLFTLN